MFARNDLLAHWFCDPMKRQIIVIDEESCTGCGQCEIGCPEGALKVIDGKARLVSELLCDGLGACIGDCPEGAISVETREAEAYDERRVLDNIIPKGHNTLVAHFEHLYHHGEKAYLEEAVQYLKSKGIAVPFTWDQKVTEEARASGATHDGKHGCTSGGCPGTRTFELAAPVDEGTGDGTSAPSWLRNWPLQLKLVNPSASYFDDADLLVAADCVGFAHLNFHAEHLKGKTLVMFCPKLDGANEQYIEKLAMIFKQNNVRSVTVLHMLVPCCLGINMVVQEAITRAGKDIPVIEHTISLDGKTLD